MAVFDKTDPSGAWRRRAAVGRTFKRTVSQFASAGDFNVEISCVLLTRTCKLRLSKTDFEAE